MADILNSRVLENSHEHRIRTRHSEVDGNLGKLRLETSKYTIIGPRGEIKASSDKRLVALQEQISREEARLAAIDGNVAKIGAILDSHSVMTTAELRRKYERVADVVHSLPAQAWRTLEGARGIGGAGVRYRGDWLPADLLALPEVQKEQEAIRAKLETAKRDVVPLREALNEIDLLASQALAA